MKSWLEIWWRQATHDRRRAYHPALEALEDRCLPAPLPTVLMTSASQVNAQTINFSYEIDSTAIGTGLPVQVYKSADKIFNKAIDIAIDPIQDFSGTIGFHANQRFVLSAALPPDPLHKFILVVANPNGSVMEGPGSVNTAFYQKHLLGVVVHGLEIGGQVPAWEPQMAAQLLTRGYDATIAFDWAQASRLPVPGVTIAEGARLALEVEEKVVGFNGTWDLQFIGHSRGAVVISEAMQDLVDLQATFPTKQLAGYKEMTYLDPHPASNTFAFYSFANTFLGNLLKDGTVAFQALAQDPQPFVPPTVNQAEVYYQNTPVSAFPSTALESILNLWGQHPVINNSGITVHYGNLTSPGLGHGEVPYWYLCNVVPHLPSSNFIFPPRSQWMVCWTDQPIPTWLSSLSHLPPAQQRRLSPLGVFERLYGSDRDQAAPSDIAPDKGHPPASPTHRLLRTHGQAAAGENSPADFEQFFR
jgi:hypothetical protein